MSAGWNLPDGCSPNDPHFDPEEPTACVEGCNYELMGGEECPGCGETQPTEDERREDAAYDAAEARAEMERDQETEVW